VSAREPVAVIGTGYVGLVTAAGFAELGSEVFCVDVDAEKVARLERGEIPIYEPGLEEVVSRNRARLHFSTELGPALAHARLLFVAVGTPPTYSGDADLSAVYAVVDALPSSEGHALVMKSTVPVGTGAAIRRRLAATGKEGLAYVSCPEFLKEGSAVADFRRPDRVVVGDEGDWAGDAVAELYAPLDAPLVRTDIPSAEMVKLASNAFLATKISFINEIANVCEETGADVAEVARGMGLDGRIGPQFLQAGIGFGGSCFAGEETLLVRWRGRIQLLTLAHLWERVAYENEELDGMLEPQRLEAFSWVPGEDEPRFLSVSVLTRRDYEGEMLTVHTKMGRRISCTPDHPWCVSDGRGGEPEVKLAEQLGEEDWVPLVVGRSDSERVPAGLLPTLGAVEDAGLEPHQVVVRPEAHHIQCLAALPAADRTMSVTRFAEVKRTGSMRLSEAAWADVPTTGATFATAKNGNQVPEVIVTDEAFWRVVGLYLAEGNTTLLPHGSIDWSFNLHHEQHLVDEVVAFWSRSGLPAPTCRTPTAHKVTVNSRLLAHWWIRYLGLGRTSYEQRLPDALWEQTAREKWAVLSALFEGDGSWSLINGGPSVIIELGTVSDELADGVLRLLGELGILASRRVGRGAKSTKDTHWIRISGAEQVERAIVLVPERDRPGVLASIARQAKRIAPTGYRRFGSGPAWTRIARVERRVSSEPVFSLEVPASHTVVGTGGLTLFQCFPKDVSALKQLAGNTGYHFQLLTAVVEVNELQKRRVIGKLQKHLGSLVGKEVALLGLAFKPHTDDMREASSLVLAARLQADGARVRAYDPVAEEEAGRLLVGVDLADDALGAIAGADAVVLVTEWPEFGELDLDAVSAAMRGDLLVDGRNYLDPAAVRAAGLKYEGVGRAGEK